MDIALTLACLALLVSCLALALALSAPAQEKRRRKRVMDEGLRALKCMDPEKLRRWL